MTKPLERKIAVVAGATRGAGRGIARMLGEAGATVYCSGRSVAGRPATGTRPETIEETAQMVTDAGGRGIAVQTDLPSWLWRLIFVLLAFGGGSGVLLYLLLWVLLPMRDEPVCPSPAAG